MKARAWIKPTVLAALTVLLAILFAVVAPLTAHADTNTEYTLTVGQVQGHYFTPVIRQATATFQVKAGLAYRVGVLNVNPSDSVIGFAIYDSAGAPVWGGQSSRSGADYGYAWPASDQTMTVGLTGWFTSGPTRTYSIEVQAFRPWTVDGTAYDMTTGRALPGTRVELIHVSSYTPSATEQTTVTDEAGRYSFAVPLPDKYLDSDQRTYVVRFVDPAGVLEGEYSGGQVHEQVAARLTLVPGGHTLCDGHLGRPWTVASTIRDASSGAPVPGALLDIYHWSWGGWWVHEATYAADADGFVTFSEPAHTADRIMIHDPSGAHPAQYLEGTFDVFDSVSVQPTAGTTWSEDLTVTVGQTVAGRVVTRSTGAALAGITVEAWRNVRLYGWVTAGSAVTDADGRYSLRLLPGPYRIGASDPSGTFREQWNGEAGSRDLASDLVVAGAPSECIFRFSGDMTPPVTAASAPLGWVKGRATVTLDAQDGGEGVRATFYRLPGETATRLYETPIELTTSGRHTLTFWSVDRMDNVESERSVSAWVDADAPGLTTDAVPRYEGSAVIRIAAGDAHSGVANVAYRVDGGAWTTVADSMASAEVSAPGLHTLEYRATDVVGNESAPHLVLFAAGDYQCGASCSASASPTVVRYGGTTSVTGTLALQVGGPAGMPVLLERSVDGITFQPTGATTSVQSDGRFEFSVPLTRSYHFRVRSAETSHTAAAVSAPVLVQATASIPRPSAPSSTYSWRTIKVSGTLLPRHGSGNRVIKIRCYRYEGRKWVWRKSLWASSRSGSTASTYSAYLRLSRGSWRIYAQHEDSSHARTDSVYRSVKVR